MKITNSQRLPQSFVEMASAEFELEPMTFRVTSLLKGIRETLLEKRHASELTQDVSDMIWLLFGTAVHKILEMQTEASHEIKEARLSETVAGVTISGQFDLYDSKTKTITDYKTCSAWKVVYGDYKDWRRQLLIYAWLLTKAGFEVEKGEVVAIMKDHDKNEAKFKPDYPNFPVKKITFTFSEQDFIDIEVWLTQKAVEIISLQNAPDDDLPLCTPEERYNKGDKYAVMKKGRKTAMRVLDFDYQAEQWKKENGGDYIEVRKGEDKKCANYCSCKEFCSYYKSLKGEENGNEEN